MEGWRYGANLPGLTWPVRWRPVRFADSNAGRSLQDRPVKAGALTERRFQIMLSLLKVVFMEKENLILNKTLVARVFHLFSTPYYLIYIKKPAVCYRRDKACLASTFQYECFVFTILNEFLVSKQTLSLRLFHGC